MQYQITGKQIDIGDALRTHVRTELAGVMDKYAQRPTYAQITFSRVAHESVCDVMVDLSSGLTATSKGRAGEIYAAFDDAATKMEKQLRRYKRRLKNHHQERTAPVELTGGSAYILAAEAEDAGEDEPETLAPVIVAEMKMRIPQLSVGEAVMQMELDGAPVLVFRNEKGGAVNVVYRRDDGHVGWIDPATVA